MVNEFLVTLVNSVLGEGKKRSRGNRAYICPFHEQSVVSEKLEINFDENSKNYQKWCCWVCNDKAKGKKLISLFKRLEVSPNKIEELKSIVKDKSIIIEENNQTEELILPKEFKSFVDLTENDLVGRHALSYLKKNRGLTKEDIIKHNLGYCENGKYSNMVIIPSYDANGKLNYFSGRSFVEDSREKKNPSVSRNIIPFEFFINWNLPIILCEGPLDAITIKRNAIPLLGKNIGSELMKKLVLSKVDKIYVALDKDAQKQALRYCEQLMQEGKEIYLIDLDDKDPSKLGFEHFTKLIQNTYPLTFSGLLEKKLSV